MVFPELFEEYKVLVRKADNAFKMMRQDYGSCIPCRIHCYDCCYAIFGLFLIEAVYINYHFHSLKGRERREAIIQAEKMETELLRVKDRISIFDDDPKTKIYGVGKHRVRCPLLNDQKECILYDHRPIACRLYGIPISINGKASVCGKTEFRKGVAYPTFNLDTVYKELYRLSKELLEQAGSPYLEKAALLISVSKAIRTPLTNLMEENFE